MSKVNYEAIWNEANAAFQKAYNLVDSQPVAVAQAHGWSNQIDFCKRVEVIDGLCGFAWINVGDGRTAWAKWLKANKGASNSYYGGVQIWSSKFSGDYKQSLHRKEAGCEAAAEVFKSYGLKAYVGSRLD
jgi:hypothetical protein